MLPSVAAIPAVSGMAAERDKDRRQIPIAAAAPSRPNEVMPTRRMLSAQTCGRSMLRGPLGKPRYLPDQELIVPRAGVGRGEPMGDGDLPVARRWLAMDRQGQGLVQRVTHLEGRSRTSRLSRSLTDFGQGDGASPARATEC